MARAIARRASRHLTAACRPVSVGAPSEPPRELMERVDLGKHRRNEALHVDDSVARHARPMPARPCLGQWVRQWPGKREERHSFPYNEGGRQRFPKLSRRNQPLRRSFDWA